jgi:hypothetical protein
MAEWAARQNSPAIIDSIGIAETRDLATRRFDQVAWEYFPLWQKAVNARLVSQSAGGGREEPTGEHDWAKSDAWLAAIKSQVSDEVRQVWHDRRDWYGRACAAKVVDTLSRAIAAWRRRLRDEELLLIQSWEQLKQSQQFGDVIKKATETLAEVRRLAPPPVRSRPEPATSVTAPAPVQTVAPPAIPPMVESPQQSSVIEPAPARRRPGRHRKTVTDQIVTKWYDMGKPSASILADAMFPEAGEQRNHRIEQVRGAIRREREKKRT